MNCKNCGFPLNGNQVCPSCGTPVNSNDQINGQQVVQNSVPVNEPVAPPVIDNNQGIVQDTVPVNQVNEPVSTPVIDNNQGFVQNSVPVNQINEPVSTPVINNNQGVMQSPIQGDIPVMPSSSDPNINSTPPKKKNVGLIVFFIVIAILILGAGVFFGIKYLRNSSDNISDDTETSIIEEEKEDEKELSTTDVYITLDDMSADEIVENVKIIAKISDNNVARNFTDRFILSGNDHYLQGAEDSFGQDPIYMFASDAEKAYISAVYAKNLSEAEDGTITIKENSYIDTYLTIADETFAKEIYTSFKTMYTSLGTLTNEDDTDNKYTADYEINGLHYMLGLVTYGTDYQLHAQIPVK